MRTLVVSCLIICCLALQSCSEDSGEPMVPDKDIDTSLPIAPNFTLLNTELEEITLTDFSGKVVLLDFWATWCKPCEEEIPIFIGLYDDYRAQGFEVVGISLDDERLKVVAPFIEELGVNYTILLGEAELLDLYDIPVMPSAFLITREGRIAKPFFGAQGDRETYEKEFKKLL
ncbi:MAG: TlpA disulfide reductase family protein [Candidatus Poribacteria bacterium]|nr:TlpA disulfide reductase family protein [Candidatus Poribacteria bacterium]